jgi:predicted type IV restriction endonuclease
MIGFTQSKGDTTKKHIELKKSNKFNFKIKCLYLLKKTMEQIVTIEDLRYQHKVQIQEFQLLIHKLENKIEMLQALLQSRENPEQVKF